MPKKRRRVKVKQRILKALAKLASREEEGITDIIRLVVNQYVKKARKAKSARRRKGKSHRASRAE